MQPEFERVARTEGYLPLEDYGLIGDGVTTALISRDGELSWLCIPRFDSPPVFSAILDRNKGGAFSVTPEELVDARQRYESDTGILVTEMRTRSGVLRLTDAMPLRSQTDLQEYGSGGRREVRRQAEVVRGTIDLRIKLEPRGGAQAEKTSGGLTIRCGARPQIELKLLSTAPLDGMTTTVSLHEGDRLGLVLRWGSGSHNRLPETWEDWFGPTAQAWRSWLKTFSYQGPQEPLVRRSAITLKMLEYTENGAIIAAPTSSLPEIVGGPRNWDYRYVWIRDAAFSVYALRRIGLYPEARAFLAWVLDAIEDEPHPRVLYDLDGVEVTGEEEDQDLEGYRQSRPVRWGNGASLQRQHDVYGEVLDCAYQWARHGGGISPELWGKLRELVEHARREWHIPDRGIWEVRTAGRRFTYSAALCQVALDRGARLAEQFNLPGARAEWRAEADRIRQAILTEAWDPDLQSLTEQLGPGGGLDAALLALPLRRVLPATDPRMISTTQRVTELLGAGNGLLYRYHPTASPDGIETDEGAFLLCSFWLVDNLAGQGRLQEALDLYDSLCARASLLGLLSEQIDPSTGGFLGNFPQAFSHVGLISSGVNLARRLAHREGSER